jgi:hypothetical protein
VSASVRFGLDLEKRIRAEFEDVRTAAYEVAAECCRGRLLNERGVRAGVDAWDLFQGPAVRARAYASEELLEHWSTHPRPVFVEYERQALRAHLYELGTAA